MNHTLPAITLALALASTANAQGVRFGRMHLKQRAGQMEQQGMKQNGTPATVPMARLGSAADKPLDEYQEKRGDAFYRYVYAYDKDLMRSSETIYKKVKGDDGRWGEETLYDIGNYLYEYDSQGRVKAKTVSYGKNEDFVSYRVMVDYGTDGTTTYTRYELDSGNGGYWPARQWSCYDSGQLASSAEYDYDGRAKYARTFAKNGIATGGGNDLRKYVCSGTVNDSTVTHYWRDDSNAEWRQERIEANRHHNWGTGRLAVYKCYGTDEYYGSYEERMFEFGYDGLGRITSIKKYYTGNDDDSQPGWSGDTGGDGATYGSDSPARAGRAATGEPQWRLEYSETYEYWGDEVYGVGNPWHDVFGMDGPLKRIYLDDEGYITQTLFERDASGKLLSVSYSDEDIEGVTETGTVEVDADGLITRIEDTSEETYGDDYYYYSDATEYTWEGGLVTEAVNTWHTKTRYPDGQREYTEVTNFRYSYGEGSFTVTAENDQSANKDECTITDDGSRYSVATRSSTDGTWTDGYRFVREVQQEDVSFVMPDISADMAGFSPDSTVVASVAGRVVCAYDCGYDNDMNYGFHSIEEDNSYNYMNAISGKTYFAISHDGDETVCSDIEGRPIYVVAGGRLVRQYIYHKADYGNAGPTTGSGNAGMSRAATVPAGLAYDEITYTYDSRGRIAGRTEVSVSEDGTRTEEVKLEYTYNEAAAIATAEATAKAGVRLTGRTLGMADGSRFSVYNAAGQLLAEGTTEFTPAAAGIYIVKAGGLTAKVAVR